jgi:hypothetical protein
MMALGATGDRRLTGGLTGDLTPCTHDACGRRLVEYATDHGAPQIYVDSAYGGIPDGASFADLDGNGANVPISNSGNAHTISVNNNQLEVKVEMQSSYADAHDNYYQCKLVVTPQIRFDADDLADTSKTFADGNNSPTSGTDANGNAIQYATLASKEQTDLDITDSTKPTFVVVLDKPTIEGNSLGYLAYDLQVNLACEGKNNDGDDCSQVNCVYPFYDDYASSTKARAQFTIAEHATDTLDLVSTVGTVNAAPSFPGSHKSLGVPVSVDGLLKTETHAVRFPAGEWDTFGATAKPAGAGVQCQWDFALDNSHFSGINGYTDEANIGKLDQWYDASKKSESNTQEYNGRTDVKGTTDCPNENVGVACGIQFATSVDWSDAALGFQLPLSAYYATAPKVVCAEQASDGLVGAAASSETVVDLTGGDSLNLGSVSTDLALAAEAGLSTADYGDDFFVDDGAKHLFTQANDDKGLFTIGAAADAPWRDIADEYDYTFSLAYTQTDLGTGGTTDGTDLFAGHAADAKTEALADVDLSSCATPGIACLNDILTAKITALQSNVNVAREDQYEQQRSAYKLKRGTTDKASKDIAFRRSSTGISLNLDQTDTSGDGRAKYNGDAPQPSIAFPGQTALWDTTLGGANRVDGHSHGATNGGPVSSDLVVSPLPAPIQDGENFFFDFFKAGPTGLFDDTIRIDCSSDGLKSAWCASSTGGRTTANDHTGFKCYPQSVTYDLVVGKATQDDRVEQSITIQKTYTSDADGAFTDPVPTTTHISESVQFLLIGDSPVGTVSKAPQYDANTVLDALTFSTDVGARTSFGQQNIAYTTEYKHVCDTMQTSTITHLIPHCAVYSDVQVQVSDATDNTGTFSEYTLQRQGKDIAFTVSPSQDGNALAFDSTTQVQVSYENNAYGAALEMVDGQATAEASGGCYLSGTDAKCVLKDFKDVDFDPSQLLHHDANCDPTNSGGVACPVLTLQVSQAFVVPASGETGAFAQTGGNQICTFVGTTEDPVKRHVIGSQTITLTVDGSHGKNHMYAGGMTLSYHTGDEVFQPLVAIAADTQDQALGADEEYQSVANFNLAAQQGSVLPADMTALEIQLTIDGKPDARYKLQSLASGYELKFCGYYSFAACKGSDGTTVKTSIQDDFRAVVMFNGGTDPCANQLRDSSAFGANGLEIQVIEQTGPDYSTESLAHTYVFPLKCHTEHGTTKVDVSVDASEVSDSSAWNKKHLTLTLTGSSVAADQTVSIVGSGGTLTDHTQYPIVKDGNALKAVIDLDYIDTGDCVGSSVTFERSTKGLTRSDDDNSYQYALVCPENNFGIAGVDVDRVHPTNKAPFLHRYGDILRLQNAQMQGRTGTAIGATVTVDSATLPTGEEVVVLDEYNQEVNTFQIADDNNAEGSRDILFKIKPQANDRIRCSFITVILSSDTASSGVTKTFQFQLPCPRTKYTSPQQDSLSLNYEIEGLTFTQRSSTIELGGTPTGGVSQAQLGLCKTDGSNQLAAAADASCALNVADGVAVTNTLGGVASPLTASQVMRLFDTCDGNIVETTGTGQGTFAGSSVHEATVKVAREYTHASSVVGGPFSDSHFCEEVDIRVQAMISQDKSATITVAQSSDMDFEVHIASLEYEVCDADAVGDGYALKATLDMQRKLGSGAYVADVQSYYRSSDDAGMSYSDSTGTLSDPQTGSASSITVTGSCQKPGAGFDESAEVGFTMLKELNNIVYYAHASIELSISEPQDEQQAELTFLASDLTITVDCAASQSAFVSGVCNGGSPNGIPSDYNLRATISVKPDEAAAFHHTFGMPQYREAATIAQLVGAFTNVSELGASYVAQTDAGEQDLVNNDKDQVQFALSLFNGKAVQLQWTVTRDVKARRLRRLLTYTFGSDGSVEKSTSLTVAPAVRESEGAAVQSGDKIVEEITEETADGVTTTKTRTTKVSDKSEIQWTGPEIAVVVTCSLALAGVAVILIKGCAASKESKEKGYKAVGTIATAQTQLWNRNRFAP